MKPQRVYTPSDSVGENLNQEIYRMGDLKLMLKVSSSTIYRWISQGVFPRPIQIGSRSVGWISSEVHSFIQQCIAERGES